MQLLNTITDWILNKKSKQKSTQLQGFLLLLKIPNIIFGSNHE
jgi:hypothetical protein